MTKLLDPKPLIPIITGAFGMHPSTLLHGESTRSVTLAKWCCYHFMSRCSHASVSEISAMLQCHISTAKYGISQIAGGLAGTRKQGRCDKGPTNAAIKDAVAQCEAAILKHFPQLNTTPAPETRRP